MLNKISEIFGVDLKQINLDTSPGDFPEWDSLGHLNLLTSFEDEFNITFDMDETMSIQSIKDLKNILEKKGVDWS
jgi:acyl carrier protein